MKNNIYDELKWRGMIHDEIDGVEKLLKEKKVTLYNGFDPTADSLHVGIVLQKPGQGVSAHVALRLHLYRQKLRIVLHHKIYFQSGFVTCMIIYRIGSMTYHLLQDVTACGVVGRILIKNMF